LARFAGRAPRRKFRERSHRRPRQGFSFPPSGGTDAVLAATGKFGHALDALAAEASASKWDDLWEGTFEKQRVALAVRAQRLPDVAGYGSEWVPEPELPLSSGARTDVLEGIDELLLIASIEIARARLARPRRSGLNRARLDCRGGDTPRQG
jgi:hypothetical protein